MAKIQWVEIAQNPMLIRFQALSEFLQANGIENEYHHLDCDRENLKSIIEMAKATFDQIRIGQELGEYVTGAMNTVTRMSVDTRAVDALVQAQSQWWPRSMLVEGLTRELAGAVRGIDLSAPAMIVGVNSFTYAAILSLNSAGITRFHLTCEEDERGKELIQHLQKKFFNIELRFTSYDRINLLPGIHSIMVNLSPFSLENPILPELNFLNFLLPTAVVVDLTVMPIETILVQTARALKYQVIEGFRVAAQTDMFWIENVLGKRLNVAEYRDLLFDRLSKQEFDLTPFREYVR